MLKMNFSIKLVDKIQKGPRLNIFTTVTMLGQKMVYIIFDINVHCDYSHLPGRMHIVFQGQLQDPNWR